MNKLIIFGANGRVGTRLIEYALSDKYNVTAFVRDRSKIKLTDSNLEIISGDVFNLEQVENAIAGKDLVFSALSGRSTKPDYSVLSVGMKNIVSGMEKAGITRILAVAGAGILDDSEYGLRRNRPNYPETFKLVSAENWKVYEALQKTKLNWTLVCAPEMPEDKRTGVYRTAIDYLPVDGKRIAVEDVADFFLQNIHTEAIFQKRVGIAY